MINLDLFSNCQYIFKLIDFEPNGIPIGSLNQTENGKYNLISVDFTTKSKVKKKMFVY